MGRVEVGRVSAVHLHVPLHQVGVVWFLRLSECGDEVLIPGDTTAVLQGCRAVSIDHAGTWCARRGLDDLLQHEYVLPAVAEVVDVVESVPHCREDLAETSLALRLRNRARAKRAWTEAGRTSVVPGAILDAELMQVSSLPPERCLENPMQLVQSQIGSQFEPPPDRRIGIGEDSRDSKCAQRQAPRRGGSRLTAPKRPRTRQIVVPEIRRVN